MHVQHLGKASAARAHGGNSGEHTAHTWVHFAAQQGFITLHSTYTDTLSAFFQPGTRAFSCLVYLRTVTHTSHKSRRTCMVITSRTRNRHRMSLATSTWHVNHGQVGHVGRVHCQVDRVGRHHPSSSNFSQMALRLILNLFANLACAANNTCHLRGGINTSTK